MTIDVMHHLKDPARLTPYEEMLLELRNQGLTYLDRKSTRLNSSH